MVIKTAIPEGPRKSFSSLWNSKSGLTVGTKYVVELDMLKGDNTPITVRQEFTYTNPPEP